MYNYENLNIEGHSFFGSIEKIRGFHEFLGYSLFGTKPNGINGFLNIHADITNYLALQLESISRIIKIGNISDSYTLLRKYEDMTLISIFLCMKEEAEYYRDRKIEDWPWTIDELNNWVLNKRGHKMASYEKIDKYLRTSFHNELLDLLESKIKYTYLRKNAGNRYTHFNHFKTIISFRELEQPAVSRELDQFEFVLTHYFIRYFALLANAREDFLRSSDYIDYLDAGLTPPDDALFWVSSLSNDILNEVVNKHRPDIASFIVNNTQMQWDLKIS
ncbi:MAG: hypothetical protein IPN29_21235 [Saprospiraceae bacterium]|nr:hypothetical protein [Saprospiraceae bacterium]